MFTSFLTTNDINNLNYIQSDDLIKKHYNNIYFACEDQNADFSMRVVSMTNQSLSQFEKRSTTKSYELYRTILFMSLLGEAGVQFNWNLEFCERRGKDGNPLTGKHKVKLKILQDVGNGILHSSGKDSLGCLAVDIFNSYDGSMRFGTFIGWLISLCLNGQYRGEALLTEDGEEAFLRQRHIHKTEEEIFEEMKIYVKSIVKFLESEKVKQLASDLEDKTNEKISTSDQENFVKQIVEKRISYQLSQKFFDQGNSIELTNLQLESFMDKLNKIAREGHRGDSVYEFEQRIQEAVGANNTPEGFARRVVDRIDYNKTHTNEMNETRIKNCHIRQVNMQDQRDMRDFNLYISDLFNSYMNNVNDQRMPIAA